MPKLRAEASPTVRLSIRRGPYRGLSRSTIKRWAEKMLAELKLWESELSILITDDAEIRELNHQYRDIDSPTDVLAFPMGEGEGAELAGPLLGDIVISAETARQQAIQFGRELPEEIRMLLAHGLLHLIGWDHQTDEEDRLMRARTSELCAAAVRTTHKKH